MNLHVYNVNERKFARQDCTGYKLAMVRIAVLLVITLFTALSHADAFIVESDFGLDIAPETITDNYDLALGAKGEIAFRWKRERTSVFAIAQRGYTWQYSRNASARIYTWSAGPGFMFEAFSRGRRRLELFTHAMAGKAEYHLHDNGSKVSDGRKDFLKFTTGARFYFSMTDALAFYMGPEISYATVDFKYPATHMNDETKPVHLYIGGVAGLSYTF